MCRGKGRVLCAGTAAGLLYWAGYLSTVPAATHWDWNTLGTGTHWAHPDVADVYGEAPTASSFATLAAPPGGNSRAAMMTLSAAGARPLPTAAARLPTGEWPPWPVVQIDTAGRFKCAWRARPTPRIASGNPVQWGRC
jgi:hypothetical protein